jgi:hypothetical protein
MGIIAPQPVTITPSTHRFFDDLVTALASQAALSAGYSSHASNSLYRFLDDWTMRLACLTRRDGKSTLEIEIKPASMLTPLTQGEWPVSLTLIFGVVKEVGVEKAGQGVTGVLAAAGDTVTFAFSPPPPVPAFSPMTGMQRISANIVEHAFLAYYERHVKEICDAKSKAGKGGMPTLAFATAIRNAFAHDGKIHITKPKDPASWGGLSYTDKNNGRQVMYNDMTQGDVILLMLEMDKLF